MSKVEKWKQLDVQRQEDEVPPSPSPTPPFGYCVANADDGLMLCLAVGSVDYRLLFDGC